MSRAIDTLAGLLAHAHAIETEAMERYELLADQMEVHNNPEVAGLFHKLARLERQHAAAIAAQADELGVKLPRLSPWDFDWSDDEAPESADLAAAHYRMTPHHALTMALEAERRALEFFERVSGSTEDRSIKAMAAEFAQDEAHHVKLIEEWLAKTPAPEPGWADDPDPPIWTE